ncbi:MAG: ATP-binding protein, partial [Defluviitaleaceae bacterium]|nr:ATP-binding protein [Defluviitaleaceae bacterium]
GFVGCDNCHEEKVFTDEVAKTLRSGSLLIANALYRNEMTHNLKLAAAELEAALTETQKANDAKSDFLAIMSHEMRTPLNAIIGLTWLNMENEGIDPETMANLEKTHNAGTTLLGIVNDILDISKIESGKMELLPTEYNLASLINDTLTQNILRIGEKPIKMVLSVKGKIYESLCGDEIRLKQIINNLLSNAIKYTSEGEVEFAIECERDGGDVWLSLRVSDTGQGIKREDLDRLFENYAQLDAKANRRIEGTGLGLPITRKLCEMMDGSISVESLHKKGSAFTARVRQRFVSDSFICDDVIFNLSSFKYSDGLRNQIKDLHRASLPYARVLVVDDNPTNLDVARGLMKPYGMRIECVDGGQKAIDAIESGGEKFDAIFMDQMMPGMDGIEATKKIREIDAEYAKKIPIIALTANAVAGNEEMFLQKGFQAFLSKPIDINRLDAVIRQWIRDPEKESEFSGSIGQAKICESKRAALRSMNVEGLDLIDGVKRFGGDEESYASVLRTYASSTKNLLESIGFVDASNANDYEITVHGIKGASKNICAEVVGEMAEKLEAAAKSKDYGFINGRTKQFKEAALALIGRINGLLASFDRDSKKPAMDAPERSALARLCAACDSFDMNEAYEIMDGINSHKYENDGGLVEWLNANLQSVNFIGIVSRLTEGGFANG